MKERHAGLQKIKDLQKQLVEDPPNHTTSLQNQTEGMHQSTQHSDLNKHVRDLNKRWYLMLRNVKQQHNQLSTALAVAATRALSPTGPLSPVNSFASSRGSSSTRSSPSVSDSVPSSPQSTGSKDKHFMSKSKSLGTCSSDSLDDLVESLKEEANAIKKNSKLTSPPPPPSDHQVNGWRDKTSPRQEREVNHVKLPLVTLKMRTQAPLTTPSRGITDSTTFSHANPLSPPPPPPVLYSPPRSSPPVHGGRLAEKLDREKRAIKELEVSLLVNEAESTLPLLSPSLEANITELQVNLLYINAHFCIMLVINCHVNTLYRLHSPDLTRSQKSSQNCCPAIIRSHKQLSKPCYGHRRRLCCTRIKFQHFFSR